MVPRWVRSAERRRDHRADPPTPTCAMSASAARDRHAQGRDHRADRRRARLGRARRERPTRSRAQMFVLLDVAMPAYTEEGHGSGYGEVVQLPRRRRVANAKRGAVAVLMGAARSPRTASARRTPARGGLRGRRAGDQPRGHRRGRATLLARLEQSEGRPPCTCTWRATPSSTTSRKPANVIGELRSARTEADEVAS